MDSAPSDLQDERAGVTMPFDMRKYTMVITYAYNELNSWIQQPLTFKMKGRCGDAFRHEKMYNSYNIYIKRFEQLDSATSDPQDERAGVTMPFDMRKCAIVIIYA